MINRVLSKGACGYLIEPFSLKLTLPAPCISESCIKIKINFNFTLLFDASKGFMKALKAFIKPFEASQRSVKIRI